MVCLPGFIFIVNRIDINGIISTSLLYGSNYDEKLQQIQIPTDYRLRSVDEKVKRTRNPNDFSLGPLGCQLLLDGATILRNPHQPHRNMTPDEEYKRLASDCQLFKRDYRTQSVSEEEVNFPIAYSIVMYKDVEQFERLLRAIYRPQNLYCVHVDNKSDVTTIRDSVKAIANCFPNVFVVQNPLWLLWCDRTVLEADLICMAELLKFKSWKYFINLTGQEWPLKTNWELVKILKVFNGSNNIEGTIIK